MQIRDAAAADAAAACAVLRRSITELCIADHRNDPDILAQWLGNKTPENVAAWIARPGNTVLIAHDGDTILGVAGVTDSGEITLNYVAPDARFRGVSHALLRALEERTLARGNLACRLTSTATAARFYRSRGYAGDGPPAGPFGTTSGIPMSRRLRP